MKHELKKYHLAGYLPYGLNCMVTNEKEVEISTLTGLYSDGSCVFSDLVESEHGFKSIKPILRPLSDISEVVDDNIKLTALYSFDIDKETNEIVLGNYHHRLKLTDAWLQLGYLYQLHFDVYGLIDKGLALNWNDFYPKSTTE